jgi:hypothetical protein
LQLEIGQDLALTISVSKFGNQSETSIMPLVRSYSGLLKKVKAEYYIARMTATLKRIGPEVKNN